MQQAIIGFHLDEENDWVADLACGHAQHVRHNPPWQNRPWVMTEQGRKEKLGVCISNSLSLRSCLVQLLLPASQLILVELYQTP